MYLKFIVFFIIIQSNAFAETPSTSSIEELLRVTKSEQISKQTQQLIQASLDKIYQETLESKKDQLTTVQRDKLEHYMQSTSNIVVELLSWDHFKSDIIQIYAETYTQKEVDDLIEFYRSPTGQSSIDKMPEILNKTRLLMQQKFQTILPQKHKMYEDMMKQMQ